MSDLVLLSHFELDCPEPPGGWVRLFEAEGVELVEDDIGRPALSRRDAARLPGAHRAEEAYVAEERARRQAEQDRKAAEFAARYASVPRGIPANPNMTPVEQVLASGGDERPRTVFTELLDAELARGKGA